MVSTLPDEQETATSERQQRSPELSVPGVLTTLALAAAVIVLTAVVAWHGGPIGPDASWLHWFIDHRTPALTTVAKTISALGDTTTVGIVAVLLIAVLAWRRRWAAAALIAVAMGGAGALIVVGKQLVGRDRPPVIDHLVVETNQSYPSGHALGSTVLAGVLVALVLPLLRLVFRVAVIVLAACFVLAVGVSRLYLGVHWSSDVLAGFLFGGCWLALCLTLPPYLNRLISMRAAE
ncbi:phosphatase PAP2 family protein [Nocardia sp. NPDC088792]|uniref:phosphatase PAP2 family protein n=1 Tax=Nocardia sp. NPDC088792 TaxID=3364332 RepID=UPI0038153E73